LEKKECQEIGKLEQNMHSYQVIKLDEERIFVYGGSNIKTAVTYPEIYNLKTNTSKIINVSNPYVNNFNAKLFKLSDGNIIIIRHFLGSDNYFATFIELFIARKEIIIELNNLKLARKDFGACITSDDKVFVMGGSVLNPNQQESILLVTKSIELYDYKSNTLKDVESMSEERQNPSCVVINDEFILITGGTKYAGCCVKFPPNIIKTQDKIYLKEQSIKTADLFAIKTLKNTKINSMNFARVGHMNFVYDEERILIIGGRHSSELVTEIEIFNLKHKEFNNFKKLKTGNSFFNIHKLSDGNLMIYDGTISRVKYTPEIVIIK
jgi:hypothetical protein